MDSFLIDIAIYSVILPIIVGIWRYSELEYEARLLLHMLVPVALNQFISEWWLHFAGSNNLPFYHLYIIIEVTFLALIYNSYLKKHRFRKLIPIITISFILFYLLNMVWDLDKMWVYSTYERAIEAVIILLFAGSFFIYVYREEKIMYLQKTSGFWISGGLILYFASNLLLFVFSELVYMQELELFESIWEMHAVLTILLYIFYSIAFLCKKASS